MFFCADWQFGKKNTTLTGELMRLLIILGNGGIKKASEADKRFE